MLTSDFDYLLPPELIAQHPAPERDQSRLLVVGRSSGLFAHHRFHELQDYLYPGDLLVLNDSRVIPARLRGIKERTGSKIECLLIEETAPNDWWVLLKPAKRLHPGDVVRLTDPVGQPTEVRATLIEKNSEGHCRLHFSGVTDIMHALDELGEIPLPPYIQRAPLDHTPEDRARYQTVYAGPPGSVAAPTAGLHFTPALLETLRAHGIENCRLTLHVGLGTFAPVKVERTEDHLMHEERFQVPPATAAAIQAAKAEGRRVIPVGTTSLRVLETLASRGDGRVTAGAGRTSIFIHPPFEFRVADALLTNFHLPKSTLLMLVSAFAASGRTTGRELLLAAYAEAVRERYRFFSYGDAMLLI